MLLDAAMLKLLCIPALLVPALARAQPEPTSPPGCEPTCRDGFTCIDGACVTACNPACAAGELCTGNNPGVCTRIPAAPTPPAAAPQPTVSVAVVPVPTPAPAPAPSSRVRFGIYAGGLTLSDPDVSAYAGGAIVSWSTGGSGWEPRVYLTAYRVETASRITTGGAVLVQSTYWFGTYGFGAGAGLGYAELAARGEASSGGEPAAQVLFFLAPVMLRFGDSPQLELGIKSGTTRFSTRDEIEPFGYVFAALHF